jgi:pectin methylesterase-like acyl-CoA thioesterase
MKQITLIVTFVILALAAYGQRVIVVEKNSAESLLAAIDKANKLNEAEDAERLFILIPDGYYDLGETMLTRISGHNVALVGQSMEGTVIRNKPDIKIESISKTAIFQNRGSNNYYQDLTLKNDLDYYSCDAAGRAVCWQDKGYRAIFKRVRMLSYQDTYYSHSEECQHYFEDSEIHGTVDFICGAGDVFFNRCLIVTEKCKEPGHNVIAAPRTSTTEWGYVFSDCTIRSVESPFHLARGWHTHPRCVWLNTRLETPEMLQHDRYDPYGIRSVENEFYEFHTTDAQGRDVTPKSNRVTFIHDNDTNTVETIIPAEEAARFTLRNVFPDWKPDEVSRRLERKALKLRRRYLR